MSGRRKRAGRGALVILALILASSAALRLGSGFGEVMVLWAEAGAKDTVAAAAPLDCPVPPLALTEALSARDTALTLREVALEDRLAALDLAEATVTRHLEEMARAEADLRATIALADGAAEDDVARLTTVYESMKPADAARLFQAMSPEFAAGFLGRMRSEAAAAVLAGMPPDAAYAISVLIAGRNARAPKT